MIVLIMLPALDKPLEPALDEPLEPTLDKPLEPALDKPLEPALDRVEPIIVTDCKMLSWPETIKICQFRLVIGLWNEEICFRCL